MGCHKNHEISYNQRALIYLGQYFLHLIGHNEQINTHNGISYDFNLGLITPLHTIVYPCFSLISRFH